MLIEQSQDKFVRQIQLNFKGMPAIKSWASGGFLDYHYIA